MSESNTEKPNTSHPTPQDSQERPEKTGKAETQSSTAPSPTEGAEPTETSIHPASEDVSAAPKKRGRPTGKRSNPDYTPVTAYIKSKTYKKVKVALLMGAQKQEFSELLEALLCEWLEKQDTQKPE